MEQSDLEALKELGVTEQDLSAIRRQNRLRNPVFLLIVGALVSIAAFVAGYLAERGTEFYPYSSVGAVSAASAQKARVPWIAFLIIALVAFLSFILGTTAVDHPVYGYNAEYSVFSRDGLAGT